MRSLKDLVPDEILGFSNTTKFLEVLDRLDAFKLQNMHEFFRAQTDIASGSKKSLAKKCRDSGFYRLPETFPKFCYDRLLLHKAKITGQRYSPEALSLWVWCLTRGQITVSARSVYPDAYYIKLDRILPSSFGGYASALPTDASIVTGGARRLFSAGELDLSPQVFTANISSPLNSDLVTFSPIREYILKEIYTFLPSIQPLDIGDIVVTFSTGAEYDHPQASPYFYP